jgi:transposase
MPRGRATMKKGQRYTPEFKAEAVKLVTEQGLSVERAAKRLGIPRGSLGNWVTAVNKGSALGQATPGARSAAELEAENDKLRKELAEAQMERDFLKKATAYFARESLPGTRS